MLARNTSQTHSASQQTGFLDMLLPDTILRSISYPVTLSRMDAVPVIYALYQHNSGFLLHEAFSSLLQYQHQQVLYRKVLKTPSMKDSHF